MEEILLQQSQYKCIQHPYPLPPPYSFTTNMAVMAAPHILLLLLFLLAALATSAQPTPPSSHLPGFTSLFKPNTTLTAVLLAATLLFTAFFFFYYCRHRPRRPLPAWRAPRVLADARGLDPRLLASFPTFLYSDVRTHKLALECAVCLSEFHDSETLTLLPACDHAFHPDCIAMWLSAHTTCPVCRAALDAAAGLTPGPPPPAAHVAVEVAGEEEEESGLGHGKRPEEAGRWWTERETERFRLVLPDEVRRAAARGGVGRSESMRGVGEGRRSSHGSRVWRWDRAARSEHWGTLRPTAFGGSSRHSAGEPEKNGQSPATSPCTARESHHTIY